MQMIKGLIALALVAIAVFTAVLIFNNRTEPSYENKMIRQTAKETVKNAQPATKKLAPIAGQKPSNSKL